jgi:uncharacterized protein YraI
MKLIVAAGLLALVSCMSATEAQAGEAAYTVRATDLKAKPFSDAATLSTLPERSRVEVLARQASWMQVKTNGSTGWVKMLSLRLRSDGTSRKAGDTGLGALFNVAETGKSGSTVTTGVRGLSEENLKTAQPNPRALEAMRQNAASKDGSIGFARAGKLEKQGMEYLPPAKREDRNDPK